MPVAAMTVDSHAAKPRAGPPPVDRKVRISEALDRLETLLAASYPQGFCEAWARGVPEGNLPRAREQLVEHMNQYVAAIDAAVSRQVNAIIHDERFQQLEASWRGLRYLVEQIPEEANVKVRILNVSWKVLVRDLDKAIEFDHGQLFQKVYCEEFGIAGGEPFSVLLGDYEIRLGPRPGSPLDDLGALQRISEAAAAAFAPFIAAAHPSLLSLDSFAELERMQNLQAIFEQPELLKWRTLRHREDTRFLGLALPRMLLRPPYPDDGSLRSNFRFAADTAAARGHLWGNPIYAFGAVLIQAFVDSGWLSEIRGVRQDAQTSGLVPGLVRPSFETDRTGLVFKGAVDVMIPDMLEPELAEQGFLTLTRCQDTEHAAFYSSSSIQRPKVYDEPLATANARIGSLLQYILCVSRFAHYVKVLGRDKVGLYADPVDVAKFLNQWISQYVNASNDLSHSERAKYPLRNTRVEVRELPGKPGAYACSIYMEPYLQFDRVAAGIRLTTELAQVSR